MNERRLGELSALSYLVSRGKPAACMAIKEIEAEEAVRLADGAGLHHHVEDLGYGWKTFWVFKRPYMKEIIKNAPEKPETVVDHWYLGKLFGYGDEEIERYATEFCWLHSYEGSAVALGARGQRIGSVIQADEREAPYTTVGPLAGFFSGLRHLITSFTGAFVTITKSILPRAGDIKSQQFQERSNRQ